MSLPPVASEPLCPECSVMLIPAVDSSHHAPCEQCKAVLWFQAGAEGWTISVPAWSGAMGIERAKARASDADKRGYRESARGRAALQLRWGRADRKEATPYGLVALVWNVFALVWAGLIFFSSPVNLKLAALALAFLACGVAFGWRALVFLMNRVELSIEDGALRRSRGPIWSLKGARLELALAKVRRFTRRPAMFSDNSGPARFDVVAALHDGSEIVIGPAMTNDASIYLKRELNRELEGE